MSNYTVSDGECLSSIAEEHGYFWETIWEHPSNAKLRALRGDPNILFRGDVVFLPPKEERVYARPTGATHTFRRVGVPSECRIQLFEGDRPRAGQSYELIIDGVTRTGTTDRTGTLSVPIPRGATEGTLTIGPDRLVATLRFGSLDPLIELQGIQQRLRNLGFDVGDIDGRLSAATRAAIGAFQRTWSLTVTGVADAATQRKLAEVHDAVSGAPPKVDLRPLADEEDRAEARGEAPR